ncbi:MAG: TetR/AcrR family transcriptional regulator [Pseudomonadota bacterium]
MVTTSWTCVHSIRQGVSMDYLLDIGTEIFRKLTPIKRQKVLRSAIAEFAEQGYRKASVNNIVRNAEISKGSLFQYFSSKRKLFTYAVNASSALVKDYLKDVRDETSGENFFHRIEILLLSGFRFIDKHPQMARIYFQLLQSGEAPFGSEQVMELRKNAERFLGELILEGMAKGELKRDLSLDRTSFIVYSLLESLLRAYYSDFIGESSGIYRASPEGLNTWVKTVIDFLRDGISNHSQTWSKENEN